MRKTGLIRKIQQKPNLSFSCLQKHANTWYIPWLEIYSASDAGYSHKNTPADS